MRNYNDKVVKFLVFRIRLCRWRDYKEKDGRGPQTAGTLSHRVKLDHEEEEEARLACTWTDQGSWQRQNPRLEMGRGSVKRGKRGRDPRNVSTEAGHAMLRFPIYI